MEVLSSRILLRPADPDRSRRFYRDTLRLAVYCEFGPADDPGRVFFGGPGFLEVFGRSPTPAGSYRGEGGGGLGGASRRPRPDQLIIERRRW